MKSSFFYILLIPLAIFGSKFSLFAQKKISLPPPVIHTVTSDNNRFFAIDYCAERFEQGKKIYKNYLKAFHIKSRKYLTSISYDLEEPTEYIKFSPDHEKVYLKTGEDFFLFDVKRRVIQKRFKSTSALLFINDATEMLAAEGNILKVYDTKTNAEIRKYTGILQGHSIDTLYESLDKNYLIGQSRNTAYLWQKNKSKFLRKIHGEELVFSTDAQKVYALSYKARLCYVDAYDLKTGKQIQEYTSNLYRDFARFNFSEGSSLHSKGKRMVFCAKRYGETQGIGVFDLEQEKVIADLDIQNLKRHFPASFTTSSTNEEQVILYQFENNSKPYRWIGDDKIIVFIKDNLSNHYGVTVNLNDTSQICTHHFTAKFEKKKRSPYGNFVASSSKKEGQKSGLVALNTTLQAQKKQLAIIDNANALSFSNNDKYLFLELLDSQWHGYIRLEELKEGKTPKAIKFSTVPFKPGQENEIGEDASPPQDYQHTYIEEIKVIEDLPEDAQLSLHFKTVQINKDSVGLQLHLLDEKGNYYKNVDQEKWQSLFCDLTIQKGDSSAPVPIQQFSLNENGHNDTLPIAMTVIMDHSGSMGDERAFIVQDAVEQLIQEKREHDEIALLKYDSRIQIESPFYASADTLLDNFKKVGLTGFGRGTALVDAAHRGLRMLARKRGFQEKAIVIFTDGNENSSLLTKNELIEDANKLGIHIYTIGFGNEIDSKYLKSIALATEGGYYQIYQTLNFLKIFKDVYRRMRSYYTVGFRVDEIGEYTVQIKPCPDKAQNDSLSVTFSTLEITEDTPEDIPGMSEFSGFDDAPEVGAVKLLNINFHFASTQITSASKSEVEKAIAYMKKYASIKVELRGHTDAIGKEKSNLMLSENRSKKIREMLIQNGIEASRLTAVGLGENEPIADNKTKEGRAKNRRTEFVIISK